MKRLLKLLLVGGLILLLAACSKGETEKIPEVSVEGEGMEDVLNEEDPPSDEEPVSSEENTDNLIPGGYFSELSPKWGLYEESGGSGSISVNTDGQLEVTIDNTGRVNYAVQIYCDGFELLQNAVYEIAFDIRSTIDRTLEWRIQLNGGDYHAYTSQENVAISTEMQHIVSTFTMEEASDPAPRFCINLGFQESDGELAAHTVYVDNVELFLLDASNAVASSKGDIGPSININQVGYRTNDTKIAIFRDSSLDTSFDVVDVATGNVVFTGDVVGSIETESAGETVAHGDFTSITKPGTYKITAANSGESYEFVIADNIYDDVFADTVKMLYLQRCGIELTEEHADTFAHAACHVQKATIYGTTETKDVSGGWHDAGDYGRYVVPGAKAVADLLLAYEDYNEVFNDSVGIPESGNGIPDVLDEARYELEWMFKMQDDQSGGVYHKVTGLKFAGTVMPEEVTDDLYIMPISNCATGDYAAVMAMAARVYKQYDEAFAKECLTAAIKALNYLENNLEDGGFVNPSDVTTGEYPDTEDIDEYFWALSELYKTTGDTSYEEKLSLLDLNSLENGLGWQTVDLYGYYAYLTADKQNPELSNRFMEKFKSYLVTIEKNIEEDGYYSSMGKVYPWGSNMTLANNGEVLLMANKILEDNDSYYELAKKQLDYLLGANSTSYCFVTGYGTLTPENTHHRPSQSLGITMVGMLVGGANSNLEDPYAQNVLDGKPAAKCYVDNEQSYSCNEVTVYWNSPLVYLMAGLNAKE
ncbi:glycoside hydrolase family 9 protein [Mobilitalea sibirica]|uniref:Endoglucanase n=1 Tax=Mobilitalea sibirica TaxID=1462919 RepID=A0A8J7H2C8_9FIRM|nr:glycoside hydrolase family 9 protein [Mobilitalea sibirica]MBH1940892.1 glycoside hydrolase family 9 protein [Mobilitalea sibirica]